jgi:hypothetical protein
VLLFDVELLAVKPAPPPAVPQQQTPIKLPNIPNGPPPGGPPPGSGPPPGGPK